MAIKPLVPHITCVCSAEELPDALAAGYNEIYIITSDGIFKRHQLRGENRFVQIKVAAIPGYVETKVSEQWNFLPDGKIPYAIYEQVEEFFRQVIKTHGNAPLEAMIFVLWNKEQGYHLWVPKQTVAAASVSFDQSTLPPGSNIVVNIHSHGHMSAFFSSTDDNNDKDTIQFSGVLGGFNRANVETKWRFNYRSIRYEAKLEDIFLAPVKEAIPIPEEWINLVETRTYPTYPATTGYNGFPKGGHSNLGNVQERTRSGVGTRTPVGQTSGTGKSYDHLRAHQFKRAADYDLAEGEINLASRANLGKPGEKADPEDWMRAYGEDFTSEHLFGDSDPNVSMIGDVTTYPKIPGHHWVWNPQRGCFGSVPLDLNTIDMDEGDPVGANAAESALAVVVENPNAKEEADQTHLGKSLKPAAVTLPGNPNIQVWEMGHASPAVHQHFNSSQSAMRQSLIEETLGYLGDGRYEAIAVNDGPVVANAWAQIDDAMSMLNGKDDLLAGLVQDMFNLTSVEGQLKLYRSLHSQLSSRDQETLAQNGF